jgi:hypothetical protein
MKKKILIEDHSSSTPYVSPESINITPLKPALRKLSVKPRGSREVKQQETL